MQHQNTSYRSLRAWNWSMAAFHLVQGVIVVLLSNDSSLPITTSYLQLDASNPIFGVAPIADKVFDFRLGPAVALFLFLSSLAHVLMAGPLFDWYTRNLSKGINKLRWFEYMASSSLMIVVVALLCGVYDLWLLVALFALNAIMNLMGLMMEVHNQTTKKTNWLAYWIGVFAGAVPWLVIFVYFFSAIGSLGVSLPGFVYAIVFTIFLTFNCFAINMVLQYKKIGPWKNYLYGERVYMILSLVAKSLLAWELFSGTLRP